MKESLKLNFNPSFLQINSQDSHYLSWLEDSSFYPQGFKKESVIETQKHWIVIGNNIVYKFINLKHISKKITKNLNARGLFKLRWKLACEEIIDNQLLSDKAYIGLRLLRWSNQKPEWISENTPINLDPEYAPNEADDVAIVMRRISEEENLDYLLEEKRTVSKKHLISIAEKINNFHNTEIAKKQYRSILYYSTFQQTLENKYLNPLKDFIRSEGGYLDQFSQTALREIKAYIQNFLISNEELLQNRLKQGLIIDCHANLCLKNIVRLTKIAEQGVEQNFLIWDRQSRTSNRTNDFLMDWAAIIGELEARGYKIIANELENYLLTHAKSSFDRRVFNFYKVAEAAKRACRGFLENNSELMHSTNNLAFAFNYALGIEGAYLLVLDYNKLQQSISLARNIKELSLVSVLSYDQFNNYNTTTESVYDLFLDKALEVVENKLLLGNSIIFIWPLNREEERKKINSLAQRLSVPCRLVNFVSENEEVEKNRINSRKVINVSQNFNNTILTQNILQYYLDLSLSSSDQALYTLKSLAPRIS